MKCEEKYMIVDIYMKKRLDCKVIHQNLNLVGGIRSNHYIPFFKKCFFSLFSTVIVYFIARKTYFITKRS